MFLAFVVARGIFRDSNKDSKVLTSCKVRSPTALKIAETKTPCGGRKTSPRTSSKVQIIFYFSPLRLKDIF